MALAIDEKNLEIYPLAFPFILLSGKSLENVSSFLFSSKYMKM